jgi:hypothetical protein
MWHVWRKEKLYAQFWVRKPKKGHHVEDLGVDGGIIVK